MRSSSMHKQTLRVVLTAIAVIALLFGVMTLLSGGKVLFGGEAARQQAGNYVPFVVWFNFLAGFAYVAAAVGLILMRPWAARLALAIAGATALAFMAFGLYAFGGAPIEQRTVGAMALRTGLWTGIGLLSWHFLVRAKTGKRTKS